MIYIYLTGCLFIGAGIGFITAAALRGGYDDGFDDGYMAASSMSEIEKDHLFI